jgi:hypothetical protein
MMHTFTVPLLSLLVLFMAGIKEGREVQTGGEISESHEERKYNDFQ